MEVLPVIPVLAFHHYFFLFLAFKILRKEILFYWVRLNSENRSKIDKMVKVWYNGGEYE